MADHRFIKKFDNLDKIVPSQRQRLGRLAAKYARQAAEEITQNAPVSDINTPGYEHMRDMISAEQIASWLWGIVIKKMIETKEGPYPLWKLLEEGTRIRPPRKFVGPVMDILGPEFLREAAKFERG